MILGERLNMRRLSVIAAAILLVILASTASAATMRAVITGTISDGFDKTGVFIPAGQRLDGLPIRVVFVYNLALGVRLTIPDSFDGVARESPLSKTDPTIVAGFEILGQSIETDGSAQSIHVIQVADVDGSQVWASSASDEFTGDGSALSITSISAAVFGNLTANLSNRLDLPFSTSTFRPNDDIAMNGGFFSYFVQNSTGDRVAEIEGSYLIDSIEVTIADVAPVPLPASGLLLIAAMGAFCLFGKARSRIPEGGCET